MPLPQIQPACPIALESVADPDLVQVLTTLELGALLRLVRYAWRQDPPCTLPDEPAGLAMVAGITTEEWEVMRGRLLLAAGAVPAPQDTTAGTRGPLLLSYARRLHDTLASEAAHRAAVRTAVGKKGAHARWSQTDDAKGMPEVCQRHALGMPEASKADSSARTALRLKALERSDLNSNLERSSAEGRLPEKTIDAPAIAGAIFDGLDAAATAKVELWRKSQVEQVLRAGLKPYQDAGRLVDPKGRVRDHERDLRRIAAAPHVTPAAAEIALGRLGEADRDPARGPVQAVMGYLIAALGCSARSGARPEPLTPYLHDQPIVDRWEAARAKVFDSTRTLEAARATAMRLDAAGLGTPAREVRRA